MLVSSLGVFVFVVSVYYLLTNAELTVREVLPGAVLATVVLEAGFQVLPVYVRYTDLNPVLKTFGPPAILLVWLYVMANVLVFGAELNWWVERAAERSRGAAAGARVGGAGGIARLRPLRVTFRRPPAGLSATRSCSA